MSDLDSTLFYAANHGSTDHVIRWAKRTYLLPADGKPRPVPVEPLKMALGNWDARNGEYAQHRQNEVKRLSMQYATYGAPWYSDDPTQTTHGIVEAGEKVHPYVASDHIDGRRNFMHPNLPRITVTDLDGNRIFTVLDDPDLTLSNGTEQRRIEVANAETVQNDMKAMEHKMNALLLTLSEIAPDAAADYRRRMNTPEAIKPIEVEGEGQITTPVDPLAMSIMDQELGLDTVAEPDVDPTPKPTVRKKAAARRGGED